MGVIDIVPPNRISKNFEKALRATVFEAVLDILGPTGTILPLEDLNHEPSVTTLTTVGAEQLTLTYSKDPKTWDTNRGKKGLVPVLAFDGVDEEADSPDNSYWSRVGLPFSIGAWVFLTNLSGSHTILSKWDAVGNQREWFLDAQDGGAIRIQLADESAVANAGISTVSDSVLTVSTWTFVVVTYDGSADATGLNIYEDSVLVASTDTDDANFIALEDTTSTFKLGHVDSVPANLWKGSMAGSALGPFFTQGVLSADAVKRLYELGRKVLVL